MYGVTTIKGLNKRGIQMYGRATLALVALILLSVVPMQAQTLENTFRGGVFVGLVRGQTGRITAIQVDPSDSSVRTVRGHIRVFDGAGNVLYQSDEVEIPPGGFHSFGIRREDLPVQGEPRTGRVQVRIELYQNIWINAPAGQDEEPGARRFSSTFELIDDQSGKTILMSLLLPAVQAAREAARK